MEIETRAWLYDVLKAITEIEGFLREVPMDFDEYQNDQDKTCGRKKY